MDEFFQTVKEQNPKESVHLLETLKNREFILQGHLPNPGIEPMSATYIADGFLLLLLLLLFFTLFYFTILYWFCHTLT